MMNDERGKQKPSAGGDRMDEGEKHDLRNRTKQFALRVLRVYSSLPRATPAQVLGKQVLRSGTSVGAHYREAYRARSPAEFVSNLESGLQELEETGYWLELLVDGGIVSSDQLRELFQEAKELTSIFVASVKTAKKNI